MEKALYEQRDQYNSNICENNNVYDKNWGSLFQFIDFNDTRLLTDYTQQLPKL
jgi:hypothetical protein